MFSRREGALYNIVMGASTYSAQWVQQKKREIKLFYFNNNCVQVFSPTINIQANNAQKKTRRLDSKEKDHT